VLTEKQALIRSAHMISSAKRFILLLGFSLFLSIAAVNLRAAETALFPTNEDLRHVRTMSAPRLSPDGKMVVLEISDDTASGGKTHLWLVDIDKNTSHQLTYSLSTDHIGERSADWSPDGESIFFLAHRGENNQLFRLPMLGGEARPYDLKIVPTVDTSTAGDAIPIDGGKKVRNAKPATEAVPMDVTAFSIAPDGKTIAILGVDPVTPGEKKQRDEKADAVRVNNDQHGTRVYLLNPVDGKLTAVAVPQNASSMTWAPASDRLLIRSEAPNNEGDLGPAASSWLVTIKDPANPTKLSALHATIEKSAWSRDGMQIYFLAQAHLDAPPGYSDLYSYSLEDHVIRNYSEHFFGSLESDAPIVAKNGDVFVSVQDGTRVSIARLANGKMKIEHFEQPVVNAVVSNLNQTGWVYIGQSSTQPATLYFAETLGKPVKALSTPALIPTSWRAASSQVVSWKNDGLSIEGLLYLPPESAQHSVPLIVDVHGGPLGAFSDRYSALTNFLVGHGWAVLQPNPRGSTGFGVAFAAANKNDLGGGDYRDIMSGVDTVLKKFPIDPEQLGLIGYSYGGEMAAFVEGKTNRFKGIVSGAPVIDQYSEYGTEDSSWYDQWYFGKPWERSEDAWRQSPLAGAKNAKTPFLLLQGASDTTDPLGQAQEMYRALRQAGVPVQLIQYPRENHGPLFNSLAGNPQPEPWHGFDARQRIVAFFQSVFSKMPAANSNGK
jgi:dipeptidyl aminopeptidase/acylaminoacyl peptidase